jgi:RNA polymerase sigma factor (sigma-70 family)
MPGRQENTSYLSLAEYLVIARKQIRYFYRHNPSLAARILKDDEAVSLVASANMMADWRFNPEVGATQKTYRNSCAFGYIKKVAQKLANGSHVSIYDLDISGKPLVHNKRSREREPVQQMIEQEEIDIVNKCVARLPPKYGEIVRGHFIHGKTMEELGQEYQISRQRIHQIVTASKEKMKGMIRE